MLLFTLAEAGLASAIFEFGLLFLAGVINAFFLAADLAGETFFDDFFLGDVIWELKCFEAFIFIGSSLAPSPLSYIDCKNASFSSFALLLLLFLSTLF